MKQILSTRLLLLKHIHIFALRDLVPFLQFKKREKHTRSASHLPLIGCKILWMTYNGII